MRWPLPLIRLAAVTGFFLIFFGVSAQPINYPADWRALRARPYPQWFKDAKLGIFIHWGIYSVPAYGGTESYGEWFLRGLQTGDTLRTNFMKRNYGHNFTYSDFAPLFKAELFKPDEWAALFKQAGARYVVMVSKHHDGYCLWPSKYARNWNSWEIGPKRDLVGELTRAVEQAGLKMGLYYSLAEWNNPLHRWYTDPDREIAPYVEQHMIPQFKELVTAYRPKVIFSDGEWNNTAEEWHAAELISWYYNLVGDEAIVNDRWGHGSDIGFLTPEYSSGLKATSRPWAEVRGLGRSFGLNRNEILDAYLTPGELIHFFVRAVANGGGMILNVGPQADGQIPLLQQERLRQLGNWLEVNGEAIYGATMWDKTEEEKMFYLNRVDPNIDFNWVRNSPGKPIREDDFTATWEGWLTPDQSGEYTFDIQIEGDDSTSLWINDRLVITKGSQSGNQDQSNAMERRAGAAATGKISLEAGRKYSIKMVFLEHKTNASARLSWSRNGAPLQMIVPQHFTHSGGQGLAATYQSLNPYLVYTQNQGNAYAIALEWPEEFLSLPFPKPVSGARVSLLGRSGYLPWKYQSGKLIVDLRSIAYKELPGHYAWTFKIENFR